MVFNKKNSTVCAFFLALGNLRIANLISDFLQFLDAQRFIYVLNDPARSTFKKSVMHLHIHAAKGVVYTHALSGMFPNLLDMTFYYGPSSITRVSFQKVVLLYKELERCIKT